MNNDIEAIYNAIYMLEKISFELIDIADRDLSKTLDIISQDLKTAVKNIERE